MKETVRAVAESQSVTDANFTDLTAINKVETKNAEDRKDDSTAKAGSEADDETAQAYEDTSTEAAEQMKESASEASSATEEKVEEFFNDEV